ncbi:MAG: NADH-quinone oxidoreductase subunit B, partial [Novosphingobium sp.]
MESGSTRLGVNPQNPALVTGTSGAVVPPAGTLPDAGFFNDINAEVSDKGFLVTSTEELFQWARTGSLWW